MCSSLPYAATRNPAPLGNTKAQSNDSANLIKERAALIEQAALREDVIKVLGALATSEEIVVICAAFRAGCADQALAPVLTGILRREWEEMADKEITDEINQIESGMRPDDWISPEALARYVAIAQRGGRHG